LFVGWLLINIRLIIKTFILKLVSLFVIIADISLDEEVLVSRDARIRRINLKEELLTLFKNEDILKYNLRFIVIDPEEWKKMELVMVSQEMSYAHFLLTLLCQTLLDALK